MKDEKAIDYRERFPQLPLDKENKFKEGSWEILGGKFFYIVIMEEEDNECVKGELVCYVLKNIVHGSKWCANKRT